MFVIELSPCKGKIEASITDKLQYYFKYEEDENKKNIRIINPNRYILLSLNMTSENYYLHWDIHRQMNYMNHHLILY